MLKNPSHMLSHSTVVFGIGQVVVVRVQVAIIVQVNPRQ